MSSSTWAVIAARNEEKHISDVIIQAKKYVANVAVVDDGSTDSTLDKASAAGAVVLQHIVNLGKGAALTTGCEYVLSQGASIVVLLDGDGQHEPKEIARMLKKLNGSDIVFGARSEKESMPIVLKFGNWVIYSVTHILYGVSIKDTQCGFRAFKARIYRKIKWRSTDYSIESEMIANVGKKKLKYSTVKISTIYSDKYKGTTVLDGVKIVFNMIWWRLSGK